MLTNYDRYMLRREAFKKLFSETIPELRSKIPDAIEPEAIGTTLPQPEKVLPDIDLKTGDALGGESFEQSFHGKAAGALSGYSPSYGFLAGPAVKGLAAAGVGAYLGAPISAIASAAMPSIPSTIAGAVNTLSPGVVGQQRVAKALKAIDKAYGYETPEQQIAGYEKAFSERPGIIEGVVVGAPELSEKTPEQMAAQSEFNASLAAARSLNERTALGMLGTELASLATSVFGAEEDPSVTGLSNEALAELGVEPEALGALSQKEYQDMLEKRLEQLRSLSSGMMSDTSGNISGSSFGGKFAGGTGYGDVGFGNTGEQLSTDIGSAMEAIGSIGTPSAGAPGSYSTSEGSFTTEGMAPGQSINTSSISPEDASRTMGRSGEKYLCGELHRQGLMPDDIYQADLEYAKTVNPILHSGYAVWAKPFAKYLSKDTKICKILTKMAKPFVVGWAKNMARRAGVKTNYSGWGLAAELIGVPACYLIGVIRSQICSENKLNLQEWSQG